MGQAKLRGSKEERVQQVKAKLDSIRPSRLTCNACGTGITDIKDMPTKGLSGIDGIFLGKCPKCGDVTQAVAGDKDAVAAYTAFIDEHLRASAKANQQPVKLPRMNIQTRRGEIITSEPTEAAIKELYGIKDSEKLVGYVVYLLKQNEYLTSITKQTDSSSIRNYDADVNKAQIFSTYVAAKKTSKQLIQDSEVQFLFEKDSNLLSYKTPPSS